MSDNDDPLEEVAKQLLLKVISDPEYCGLLKVDDDFDKWLKDLPRRRIPIVRLGPEDDDE